MSKSKLDYVLEIEGQLSELGWKEYLRLLDHALMGRAESARGMNDDKRAKYWLSRANQIDRLAQSDWQA